MSTKRSWTRAAIAAVVIVTCSLIPVRARAQDQYTSPRSADVDARGARSVEIEAHAGSLRVEGRRAFLRFGSAVRRALPNAVYSRTSSSSPSDAVTWSS